MAKEKIDYMDLNHKAIELRKKLGEDDSSSIDIFNIAANCNGLTLMFYPMSAGISGMCIKDEGNMIISLNSKLSSGRQRFTLAHELCHLYFHDSQSCYVCAFDKNAKTQKEIEADIFASYFLAPYSSFKNYVNGITNGRKEILICDVIKCGQKFGLSHLATIIRLKQEGFISDAQSEEFKVIKPAPIARAMGFSTELYAPKFHDKEKYTMGEYILLANELNERDVVSTSKYEGLLLDVYRDDIVYGEGGDCDID